MPRTTKFLLLFCSRELIKHGLASLSLVATGETSSVDLNSGVTQKKIRRSRSLGEIQRRLIQISPTANEATEIFEDVNRLIHPAAPTNITKNIPTVTGGRGPSDKEGSYRYYDQAELDWFAIEAYNRGINLAFLGDIHNAERLLGIALNLLPYCGQEVTCHDNEMRLAYRSAVARKEMERTVAGGGSTSCESSHLVRLFSGVIPGRGDSCTMSTADLFRSSVSLTN